MPESEGDTSGSEGERYPFEIVDVDVVREQRRVLEGMFTAECPYGHDQPDRYSITATYRSQGEAIETDSFRAWLESFEDREISAEELASEIYGELRECFGWSNAEVTLYQQSEAQVTLTIEMGSCV